MALLRNVSFMLDYGLSGAKPRSTPALFVQNFRHMTLYRSIHRYTSLISETLTSHKVYPRIVTLVVDRSVV